MSGSVLALRFSVTKSYPFYSFSGINIGNLFSLSSNLSVFSPQRHKIPPIRSLVNTIFSYSLIISLTIFSCRSDRSGLSFTQRDQGRKLIPPPSTPSLPPKPLLWSHYHQEPPSLHHYAIKITAILASYVSSNKLHREFFRLVQCFSKANEHMINRGSYQNIGFHLLGLECDLWFWISNSFQGMLWLLLCGQPSRHKALVYPIQR